MRYKVRFVLPDIAFVPEILTLPAVSVDQLQSAICAEGLDNTASTTTISVSIFALLMS